MLEANSTDTIINLETKSEDTKNPDVMNPHYPPKMTLPEYMYYEKPVTNDKMLMAESAMNEKVKMTTLNQEFQ